MIISEVGFAFLLLIFPIFVENNIRSPFQKYSYEKVLIWHVLLIKSVMSTYFLIISQNEADYWLMSEPGVSITDMWPTECILYWDVLRLMLIIFLLLFCIPWLSDYSCSWLERVWYTSWGLWHGCCQHATSPNASIKYSWSAFC